MKSSHVNGSYAARASEPAKFVQRLRILQSVLTLPTEGGVRRLTLVYSKIKSTWSAMDSRPHVVKDRWIQMGNDEKKAIIDEEIRRMSQLPSNSSYAMHRLRVLKKIQQLMSIQRSASQDEELELLFSKLSL